MPLIDDRGRLGGRVNVIDAFALSLVFVVSVLTYAGYALFKVPAVPHVESVTPNELTSGDNQRLILNGENFLPIFRVYVEKSGAAATLSHELSPGETYDAFTLSNRARAEFVVESQTLAQVRIPDGILPGTYDLAFYDETHRVGLKKQAFAVRPSLGAMPASYATIRLLGAFTGLSPAAVPRLVAGARFPPGSDPPLVEVITAETARAERIPAQVGNAVVAGSVASRLEVPAILRLRCELVDTRCRLGRINVMTSMNLAVPLGAESVNFFVQEAMPDVPDAASTALVTVRFIVQPEVASLMKVGDVDQWLLPGTLRQFREASLTAIRDQRELVSGPDVPGPGMTSAKPARMISLVATVQVPVVRVPSGLGWSYKGQMIRAGATLLFETEAYRVGGSIVRATAPDRTAGPTPAP